MLNRCHSIYIRSALSISSILTYSVQQGSAFKSLKYHFYADDTQIYCQITLDDAKTTFRHLQKCLGDIYIRVNSNKLKLNPAKREFMVFGAAAMRILVVFS